MDKLIAHFVGLTHPFIVCQVAKAYMDHIYMLHGQPQYVISDRDGIFTSTLWKELFKPTGKPKRMNQYLEGYLPCFAHTGPAKWFSWLSVAGHPQQSTCGCSPFEVCMVTLNILAWLIPWPVQYQS